MLKYVTQEERQAYIKKEDTVIGADGYEHIRVRLDLNLKIEMYEFRDYKDFIAGEVVAGDKNGGYYWRRPGFEDSYIGTGYYSYFGTPLYWDKYVVLNPFGKAKSATGAAERKEKEKKKWVKEITREDLIKMGWSADKVTGEMLAALNDTINGKKITDYHKICHFIGQCSVESEWGNRVIEDSYGEGEEYFDKYDENTDIGNTGFPDGRLFRGAGYIQLTGRWNYTAFSKTVDDSRVLTGYGEKTKVYKYKIAKDTESGIVAEGEMPKVPPYKHLADNYPWEAAGWFWGFFEINRTIGKQEIPEITDNEALREVVTEVTAIINYHETREPDRMNKRIDWYKKAREVFEHWRK